MVSDYRLLSTAGSVPFRGGPHGPRSRSTTGVVTTVTYAAAEPDLGLPVVLMAPVGAIPVEPADDLLAALRAQGGTRVVCTRLLAALPGIDGVALTVFTLAGRVMVAAAGIGGERAEDVQSFFEEGPCLDAMLTARPVASDDLSDRAEHQRWPHYSRRNAAAGVLASYAFPVLLNNEVIAVMNLFRVLPGPLPSHERAQTMLYTRTAAVLLTDDVIAGGAETGARLDDTVTHVQQATGMVMAQTNVDATTALHLIRQHAFDHNRDTGDIVADILHRRLRLNPLS